MKTVLLAASLLIAPAALAVDLQVDPAHSTATFAIKHMMVSTVRGNFGKVSGTVNYDPKDASRSSANIQIDPSSIDTRNEKRDGHLKSADFFDVQKCPEMTFKSNRIEKFGDKYKVMGDLTMHCVTKPLSLEASFTEQPIKSPFGTSVYPASATGKLKRSEWGLTWNKALESGGAMVSDDVNLDLEFEFLQKPLEGKKEAQAETKAKK